MKDAEKNSKALGMMRIYSAWFKRFWAFCQTCGVLVQFAGVAEMALFLQSLADGGSAGTSLGQAAAAIAWYYQVADREDPTKHKLISALVSAKRRTGKPVKHKESGMLEHLSHLFGYMQSKQTFVATRTFVISLSL